MATAKLTSKGQITVPKMVRDRLGLRAGDEIDFVEQDGTFAIEKRVTGSAFARYRGYLTNLAGQDTDAVVQEMRGE